MDPICLWIKLRRCLMHCLETLSCLTVIVLLKRSSRITFKIWDRNRKEWKFVLNISLIVWKSLGIGCQSILILQSFDHHHLRLFVAHLKLKQWVLPFKLFVAVGYFNFVRVLLFKLLCNLLVQNRYLFGFSSWGFILGFSENVFQVDEFGIYAFDSWPFSHLVWR